MSDLGVVEAIYTYPVKSFAGQLVTNARVGWHGVAEDRRYAFQKTDDDSGLPWLSAREVPRLILYRPQLPERGRVVASAIMVERPAGPPMPLDSPELLAEIQTLARHPLRLTQLWRGTFDSMPLSLITIASVHEIERRTGRELEIERFRPNVVIRGNADVPLAEEKWVSRTLVIGDGSERLLVRVNRKDPRCRIVSLDPNTAEEDSRVLARIVTDRKNLLGVYASVEFPAAIHLGDPIRLHD